MNLFPEGWELTPEVLERELMDDAQELQEASPSRAWIVEFLSSLTLVFCSTQGMLLAVLSNPFPLPHAFVPN